MHHDRIAVVDLGGQYAHLIATKIRRLHVLAEILDPESPGSSFGDFNGIIVSGSPSLASREDDAGFDSKLFDLDIPVLGFCFGHQAMAKHYGGTIEHRQREYGIARFRVTSASQMFADQPHEQEVWMSHGDTVAKLPKGFTETGVSVEPDQSVHHNAAIANDALKRYGLQFHPEVDDTEYGESMLANFVLRVCGCRPTWTMDRYLEGQVEAIREAVGNRGVFLLASGGVDSTVCAYLLGKAVGPDQLHILHVDNGLMRKNESSKVVEELKRAGLDRNLHFVDATSTFLPALADAVEPERKRAIIGELFVRVFEKEAKRLALDDMLLGQGTIYPDTIETGGTKRADVIKTHHNRVPAIERMIERGQVLEPLKELYKVEVRELGEQLDIDPELVWRHPFPGPGLGVRVLCSDGKAPEGHDPAAHQAVIDEVTRPAGLRGLLLPVRSVGVKADLRCYEQPVLVWGSAPHGKQLEVAAQLYGRVPGVNRCVVDLTGRGVTTAEPRAATLTRERLDLLREADQVVMNALQRHELMRDVWQCPTVLLPLSLDGKGSEVVIVRPVHSERAMTARPAALPELLVEEIRGPILALPGVGGLFLDLTTKPPGTIEWE